MQYRRLGGTGLKVSEISLGSWLTYGTSVELERARTCVQQAYELGINFFDSSDIYGHRPGAGEEALGEALRPFPRHSYVLATKVFWPVGPGPNDRGLSRKHVIEACDASLKRLGTDYVDLYYCHRFDPDTPLEETLQALEDLVRQGKALYIGLSMWTAAQIAEAIGIQKTRGWTRFAASQPAYNILNRSIEPEILPVCAREGVGQVVFSPLAQGVLTGKYRAGEAPPVESRASDPRANQWVTQMLNDQTLAKVDRLKVIAEEASVPLAQLALAWTLRHPEVSSALIGATRPEQVTENAKAAGYRLTSDLIDAIENAMK